MEAYWAVLTGLTEQGATKHYQSPNLPAFRGDSRDPHWESLTELPVSDGVLIWHDLDKTGGWYILRLNSGGEDCGDTWHENMDDAKLQLEFEYGHALGQLFEVPDGTQDLRAFVVRHISRP